MWQRSERRASATFNVKVVVDVERHNTLNNFVNRMTEYFAVFYIYLK
tara:strand:- start:1251 stop:1391 length:141 start_codon:yes stop_codon:yes gene_type:complete